MGAKLFICYTQSAANIGSLKKLIGKTFTEKKNIKITCSKDIFVLSINEIDQSPYLIILDLIDDSSENIELLNAINQKAPSVVKLIISDTKNLLSIQRQVTHKEQLQFLKAPFTKDDFALAMVLAKQHGCILNQELKKGNQKCVLQEVENEVAVRFHKLIDSNEAKDKILSIISHDLKSPFLGLIGISEILLKEWHNLNETEKMKFISDIKKASEETLKLLEDLLDWAKCQKEKLEISIEEIKVHNLVNSSIKVNENRAIPKGVKVHNRVNNSLKINADKHMIATVFRNLISNAVKFARPGGDIQISAKENKNCLTFCVEDNGVGVDEPRIIEIFNNGNANPHITRNGKVDYRGLGLMLCKDFVERSGGKIWLETQKGVGSKFYFTLPN